MGYDLVNACIFCAGLLLGNQLVPRDGLQGDVGFAYATLARRYDVTSERVDGSDATPKFILAGLGNSWPAQDGLGAGTPASEWRGTVAFAPSHEEQERKELPDLERIVSTGTGRFENFAFVTRFALGARDSVEIAGGQRAYKSTDIINIGGGNSEFTEARSASASRIDILAGWRHRWKGLEGEAAIRWVKPSSYNSTANAFHQASGAFLGWEAEARWRSGPWSALLHGERMSGSLDVHRESAPIFADRDASLPASLEALRFGLGYTWPRSELFVSATYDRQHLPFVSLAVLGTETVAFDSGFDPDSLNKQVFGDVAFRYAFSPAIRARVSVRMGWGHETVTLTDSAGVLPTQTLKVLRRGIFGGSLSNQFGSPEVTFFVGADFAIGTPR